MFGETPKKKNYSRQTPEQIMLGDFSRVKKAEPSFFEEDNTKFLTFIDQDLPPSIRSIVGDLSDSEIEKKFEKTRQELEGIIWLRFEDIYGKGNYQLFQNGIEPNDIFQGSLGNCYHLAAKSALAEDPERIMKLFKTKTLNRKGRYEIQIYEMGMPKTVTIDDFIPCDPETRRPLFARTNQNELWVLLLEKAWAKVYGSYGRIIGGLPAETLHDLTGAPTTSFYFDQQHPLTADKEDEIWEMIKYGEKKNHVMCCGTFPDLTEKSLYPSHAYSLLAAHEIKAKGQNVRLVELRNPHGEFEWKGAWSDSSPNWTKELRRLLKVQEKDDGIFFMQYEDLLRHFSLITICLVDDKSIYQSLESNFDYGRSVLFKLEVETANSYFITVNQESWRKYPKEKNYKQSEIKLSLLEIRNGQILPVVGSVKHSNREIWSSSHLQKGSYFAQVEIASNQKRKKFSISSYGRGQVQIEEVDYWTIQEEANKSIKHAQQAQQAQQGKKSKYPSEFLKKYTAPEETYYERSSKDDDKKKIRRTQYQDY